MHIKIVWLKKVESNVKLFLVRSSPAESSEAKIPTYCRVHQYLLSKGLKPQGLREGGKREGGAPIFKL